MAAGWVWPAERGRWVLDLVSRAGQETERDDLVGVPGARDGSGSSDLVIRQAGAFCLKTSSRRRFVDVEDGRAAMVVLARRKTALGRLLPPDTTLCLSRDADGGVWLWTIARWLVTLRAAMSRAVEAQDEPSLGAHLASYAGIAAESLDATLARSLVLDVHPSNFGSDESGTYYVDDDVASGVRNLAIGHALLQRVEEYATFPAAIEVYLRALEERLARFRGEDAERLELRRCLEGAFVRSPAAHRARLRLFEALARPPRKASVS